MNVADKFVKILEEEGIRDVFGIPGEQIMPLYKSLSNSNINHVLTRHEQAAAHAAHTEQEDYFAMSRAMVSAVQDVTAQHIHIFGVRKGGR